MKLRLLIALLACQVSFAQPDHRTCGMQEQMQRIMNDPAKRAAYLELQSKFETELQKLAANNFRNTNTTIRIPVAVHFPSISNSSTETIKNCYRALAQTQINILNADYNGTNADIANYQNDAPYYPGTNTGNMDVQFILGTQNHPAGTGLANGVVAVTFGTDFLGGADEDTTWAGYMNLVVRNEGNQILGYSPLGGSPSAGETVVINRFCFGSGSGCTPSYVPTSPYNLGRTLTHELGHFFNLQHTFGPVGEGNGCVTSNTDNIADTPKVGYCSYDCPAAGEVAGCVNGQYALTMNFMDYVNDACMYMFTAGQAARMQAYYNVIASQFTTTALANDEFLQNQFKLYPNPNKGTFTLEFKDFSNSFSVQVFDMTGKVIYENNYDQSSSLTQTIKLDKPASGVYFINVRSDKGLVTKKLIVE
ncbi:MAG: zinc-dependent metalloprotease [Flavobacterium sp.]